MHKTLSPRRAIPRWRDSQIALSGLEVNGLTKANEKIEKSSIDWQSTLEKRLITWDENPVIGVASEAISLMPFLTKEQVLQLKPVVKSLEGLDALPFAIEQMVQKYFHTSLETASQEPNISIPKLRRHTSEYPHDAIAWLDLARQMTALGKKRAALRAVQVAVNLAPCSRFIVRSAARFFVHIESPDVALRLLRRTEGLRVDPWLLAAEISISSIEGRTSQHIKTARQLIEKSGLHPAHLTELAAVLATTELQSGKRSHARKLFDVALLYPNDNVIAQAEWSAQEMDLTFNARSEWIDAPLSFEARALRLGEAGDFEASVREAHVWFKDEPFSSRPPMIASFIESILGHYDKGIETLRAALISNPNDTGLLNNLFYCLVEKGELDAAIKVFQSIATVDKNPSFHTLANMGMLLARIDRVDQAFGFYEQAISGFRKLGEHSSADMATVCLAREAYLARVDNFEAYLYRADETLAKSNDKAALAMRQRIGVDTTAPTEFSQTPSSPKIEWQYDRERNILLVKRKNFL